MSKMFDKLSSGELALGTINITNTGPEWVEVLSSVGFDFIVSDFMITSVTWESAANMARAARQFDVSPWLRLQGYPWNGYFDARMVSDVMRALSIGMECVMMSIDTPEEVQAVLKPQSNWHRRVHVYQGNIDAHLEEYIEKVTKESLVIPHIESRGAANQIESILDVPGLRAIWLGMGDLSRELGHPGDPTHPDIRAFITRAIKAANERGVMVMANTGHLDTIEENRDAAVWLWEAGISAVWVTYPEYVIQRYYLSLLEMTRQAAQPRVAS
jgi:4-hydroxy-2-oxoheptanedioate aldolase